MSDALVISRAFYEAGLYRPYKYDAEIVKAATPLGGEWSCVAKPGAVCRSIMWGGMEVAYVNPSGAIDDMTEGQIAMAMRALPTMDAALRSIIALAEKSENLDAIRNLATSVIAFVEMPAPRISEPEDEEEQEDGDDE